MSDRKRVAIIGSGVSGLAALWLLNEYSNHEVNIYEKEDYPGGHTHTVEFNRGGKQKCQVDTGFIVLNPPTYPNLLRFLKLKKIPLNATEMTFSVSRDGGKFEWAGDGPAALFCQWGNILNPRLYRMLFDVFRFNRYAPEMLKMEGKKEIERMSIGEYLEKEGYGDGFKEDYLLPMTGAIWSTPADKAALDFPALTLIRFFHNHHLLQITGKPKWLTVKGGAKLYVESILKELPKENLHLNTEIVSVGSVNGGVELVERGGAKHVYDHVILATHSDTSLQMLRAGGGATSLEEKALAPWEWSNNEAVLHWDEKFMPVRRRAYSAWNYLTSTQKTSQQPKTSISAVDTVSLTYSMNILQHLPESKHGPVLVTLNPLSPVDPLKTIGSWTYQHPMMTSSSVSAQALLPQIQNQRGISFAGAWTKYGFHEDGFSSGMRLVCDEPFGAKPPFEIKPPHRTLPDHGVLDTLLRLFFEIGQITILNGGEMWIWVCWVMILLLGWAELGLKSLGWKGGAVEVERIRNCWIASSRSESKKRK